MVDSFQLINEVKNKFMESREILVKQKKCKNVYCENWFVPRSKNHFYCCLNCTKAQSARDCRRRAKNNDQK